jgi:hypothetical protein
MEARDDREGECWRDATIVERAALFKCDTEWVLRDSVRVHKSNLRH